MSNSILSALGSSSSRLSFAMLGAVLVSASASAERINQFNAFQRHGTAGGVGAIFSASVTAEMDWLPGHTVSATRPTGSSAWQYTSNPTRTTQQYFEFYESGSSDADYVNWMQANQVGNWQYSFDFGAGAGPTSYNWDSTPHYLAESNRNYLSLTASSAYLFEQIRSQGLTGTFTFDLTAPVSGTSNSSIALVVFGGAYTEIYNGVSGPVSTFTMTFNEVVDPTAVMRIALSEILGETIISATGGLNGDPITVVDGYLAETIYGLTPVPAPGAIALFGIAGLAGRRRRR